MAGEGADSHPLPELTRFAGTGVNQQPTATGTGEADDIGAAIAALADRFGHAGRIAFEAHAVAPLVELRVGGASARVALNGAQLLGWQPAGEHEVIWVSPDSAPTPGKSIRGGTPVCWPWFGADTSGFGRPAHGFVRGVPWDVAWSRATAAESAIALRYRTTPETTALWPHDAEALLTVSLTADTLTLSLTTTNTGISPFSLTQALHTYFAVSDIAGARVDGLDGCGYIDAVGAWTRHRQQGAVTFAGEVDRIYFDPPGDIVIDDGAGGHRIHINASGSRSAVVWNPWIDKSARLGDMGADGYTRMLCVETANAADDAIALAPGAAHTLTARYHVTRSR